MEGPSTSCAQNKLLLPEQELDDEAATTVTSRRVDSGETVEERMLLNVDPDYDDDSEYFEEGSDSPALTHRGVLDSAAIERRPGDRQDTGGVKMSIGNDCDMDEEEEETDEDQRRLFVEGIKKIARKPHESFDLEEQPDSEALRQFINQQVNNAMMFNQDNLEFQHIEYEPIIKRKVPKVIEGYMWGGVIGLGSYGKVKEVIDTYSLTRRAVKIMKYDKLRKITNGWENIRSEMSILRRLNHPNIIKLVEIFNIPSKGKVYMIFEYCIGSVQQLLDLEPAHRLSIGESHAIFIELCEGLNYLHSKRVSHKDIKPGNLLISIDFTVKICDFGVAEQIHLFQKDGRCTKVNGTPKFQPPECVYGNHEFFDGYKADMWSAGVTLYNLVSGRYPFERPILLKLYECIGTEPVEMPSNVKLTNDLEDLLCKLLEKDFNVRPTCLETMLHPWFISSFPEDQGLGRIMERMRTGDRPLTVLPSLAVLYDGAEEQVEIDVDVTPDPPVLVLPGELDRSSFPGFKFIEATLGDGLTADGEESSSGDRRSSRSMPTSAPPGQQNPVLHQRSPSSSPVPPVAAQNAPQCEAVESGPEAAERRPKRRGKRNFLSCIFRSRSDSA